jgi:hypothetical protein
MEDAPITPITTAPEELFAELREQRTVTLLSEGLLCYADPSVASVAPDELDADELSPAAD